MSEIKDSSLAKDACIKDEDMARDESNAIAATCYSLWSQSEQKSTKQQEIFYSMHDISFKPLYI